MYKKTTYKVTTNKSNIGGMTMKGFVLRLFCLVTVVISVVSLTTPHTVHGCTKNTWKSYQQFFSRDIKGTDLTNKKIKKIEQYVSVRETSYKQNRIYTVNKFGGFHVIVITNSKGQQRFWSLMEHRDKPVVTIEYGTYLNYRGDGQLDIQGTTQNYIGYRVMNQLDQHLPSKPMEFKIGDVIRTISISPGTDHYTDSLSYRCDKWTGTNWKSYIEETQTN